MSVPTLQDYQAQLAQRVPLAQGGKKSLPAGTVDQPLITLITVVFNAEKTLEKTIQSVLAQNYPALEYIVIDGASQDQTLALLQTYEDQITHWRSEPDLGIYDAMNKGIALSRGTMIGLVNAGDYLELGTLDLLAKHWRKEDKSSIFTGNCRVLLSSSDLSYIEPGDPSLIPLRMLPHGAIFVPRRVYEKQGLFNLDFKITADYDFLCRCYQQKVPFFYLPETLSSASPRGASGNYFLTEWDLSRIRWRYGFLPRLQILALGLKSFITITLHYCLEWIGLWRRIEERRYARSR
jgi:glycosyltransferase involved in cell wall biosynthesis